jgi:CubicO group peptidase (beta-lactamase class C family)
MKGITMLSADLIRQIDALFAESDHPDTPGAALAVVHHGEIVYKRGYGCADLEHRIPITPSTVFDIASTSKQFTAWCIALLAQQGKLTLEDDLRRYFQQMRDYGQPITIAHLIHHTSGIRDYLELGELSGMRFENDHTEAYILDLIFRQQALNFTPGEEHLYSNSGYLMLGEIVRIVSGQTLAQFAETNIFQPLGMTNTHFHDDFSRIVPDRAWSYLPTSDGFMQYLSTFDVVGDGGIMTTVEDLFLWDQNFYSNKLEGGDALLRQMHTGGTLNSGETIEYAFGIGVAEHNGRRIVAHAGGWLGYVCDFIRFPDEQLSVIMLCNRGDINVRQRTLQIADLMLGGAETEQRSDAPEVPVLAPVASGLSPSDLARYVARYFSSELSLVWSFTVQDERLAVQSSGGLRAQFLPISETQFKAVDVPFDITLTFDENDHLAVTWVGRPSLHFERVAEWKPDHDVLREMTGLYASTELESIMQISLHEQGLEARPRYASDGLLLSPLTKDTFFAPELWLRFERDSSGSITGFLVQKQRIRNIRFTRYS